MEEVFGEMLNRKYAFIKPPQNLFYDYDAFSFALC